MSAARKLEDDYFLAGKLWQPRQCIKKQRHHFVNKGLYSQGYGLSSSHVWLWELDHKEGRVLKNWCYRTVVLEKPFKNCLDKKLNQSILKEINPEYSLEGLMLKLKLQYFGHLMQIANISNWQEKTLMLGKTEGRRRRGRHRMRWLRWYHQCNGHELGQTAGDGEGQGSLACCSPWGREESDKTWRLNNNNNNNGGINSTYLIKWLWRLN